MCCINSAKDLIRQCLVVDPKHRVRAHEALNHQWFHEKKKEKAEQAKHDHPQESTCLKA